MESALADWRATGGRVYLPHRMSLLADAHLLAGDSGRATEFIDQASDVADVTGDRFFDAKLQLLRAEIARRIDPSAVSTAEEHLNSALTTVRTQSAKAWELRAATSLARLWQQQDKRADAHELLSEIYNWFTEGFDTKDLQDAKALLEELG
jgi:predicted ATPase